MNFIIMSVCKCEDSSDSCKLGNRGVTISLSYLITDYFFISTQLTWLHASSLTSICHSALHHLCIPDIVTHSICDSFLLPLQLYLYFQRSLQQYRLTLDSSAPASSISTQVLSPVLLSQFSLFNNSSSPRTRLIPEELPQLLRPTVQIFV